MLISFKKFDENKQFYEPAYQTDGASGMDLMSAVEVSIPSGKWAVVNTNLSVEIPRGYEIQIRPRSGLAAKHGITVLNTPGTVDSDYRGEIKVILFNVSNEDFLIKPGDRIAQMVLIKVERITLLKINSDLSKTGRGEGGFGSTGI